MATAGFVPSERLLPTSRTAAAVEPSPKQPTSWLSAHPNGVNEFLVHTDKTK